MPRSLTQIFILVRVSRYRAIEPIICRKSGVVCVVVSRRGQHNKSVGKGHLLVTER